MISNSTDRMVLAGSPSGPAVDRREPLGGRAKRIFDVVFAVVALSTGAVIFVAIVLVVKFLNPGPVFYRHTRVGLNGARFGCLKFRTMVVDADARLVEHLAGDPKARARVRRYAQAHERSTDHTGDRNVPPPDEPRRATAVLQRPARGDEHCRPSPCDGGGVGGVR